MGNTYLCIDLSYLILFPQKSAFSKYFKCLLVWDAYSNKITGMEINLFNLSIINCLCKWWCNYTFILRVVSKNLFMSNENRTFLIMIENLMCFILIARSFILTNAATPLKLPDLLDTDLKRERNKNFLWIFCK